MFSSMNKIAPDMQVYLKENMFWNEHYTNVATLPSNSMLIFHKPLDPSKDCISHT